LLFISFNELPKSLKFFFFVIPAKAGIQYFKKLINFLKSGFNRNQGFLQTFPFFFSCLNNFSLWSLCALW